MNSSATGPSGGASNIVDNTVRWDFVTVGSAWLKGWWAVFNTGQAAIVHDHTSSRVNCIEVISPTPTSILYFARPATILRNSLNDTTSRATFTAIDFGTNNAIGIFPGNRIFWQDISLEPFTASSNCLIHGSGSFQATRFLFDAETIYYMLPGVGAEGNQMSLASAVAGGSATLTSFVYANRVQDNSGADALMFARGVISLQGAYMENTEDGIQILGPFGNLVSFGFVANRVGFYGGTNKQGSILVSGGGARFGPLDPGTAGVNGVGKEVEIRGGHPAPLAALVLAAGGETRPDSFRATFKNNPGAVARVEGGGVLNVSLAGGAGAGLIDGGGNGDVGIDIVGPGSTANLNLGTNVTGANGDVRIGGSVVTYASIPSTGTGHANSASAVRRA